jgi:hypothetical protein
MLFRGQGLKRANSVRKFISTFRDSLRGSRNSLRRLRHFQRNRSNMENPLINSGGGNYRSIESARKTNFLQLTRRLYNSIDFEEPSTSIRLSPMVNEEEHSQISHLDEE